MSRIGDGPVQPEYAALMKEVARAIDKMFNGEAAGDDKKVGFVLLVFPFNDHGGRCNYMSNAAREDVVVMLKEQIKRFEGQPEMEGNS
jgi:hypothetical protein